VNILQRLGPSPTGAYTQDWHVDEDGMVVHTLRHATQAEADRLKDPAGDPNYGIGKIFGYEEKAFMRRQYK
jgi:hypothetical protein